VGSQKTGGVSVRSRTRVHNSRLHGETPLLDPRPSRGRLFVTARVFESRTLAKVACGASERRSKVSRRQRGANRAPKVQAFVAENGRDGRKAKTAHRTDRTELILLLLTSSTQSGGHAIKVMRPRKAHHWSQSTSTDIRPTARGQLRSTHR
jgi:hypothetical protein